MELYYDDQPVEELSANPNAPHMAWEPNHISRPDVVAKVLELAARVGRNCYRLKRKFSPNGLVLRNQPPEMGSTKKTKKISTQQPTLNHT